MEHWVFPLALFVVWVVRSIKGARDKAAAARNGQPLARGPHGDPIDPEAEERQRKVREQVARKIAERKILMMPAAKLDAPRPPQRAPEALEAPETWTEEPPAPPEQNPGRPVPATLVVASTAPAAPAMTPLEPALLTASQTRLAEDFERWSTVTGRAVINPTLAELRNPAELRRAVLMREILGPPVALR